MSGRIASVDPGSIAEDLGWLPGDEIISINGQALADVIDYRFHSSAELLSVVVRRGDQTAEFDIEKDIDTPLGVEFADVLFDGVRTCGARCVFCFVDQLPRGLRRSLYLKDDDFRLSFLHGNFITLGNVDEEDLRRIVTQRLSPLYISVHTTDSDLRERMLGRQAPRILDQIDALARGRITLHTQIVLCREVNDGERLERTVCELASRYPSVASIAVVPAGVTEHRRRKTRLAPIDREYSASLLRTVRNWQRRFARELGTRLVWAADEFYLSAGVRVPRAAAYEGFPQIENGVGLVRKFKDGARRARAILGRFCEGQHGAVDTGAVSVSVVTGELAAPLIREWAASVECDRLRIRVHPVRNALFGRTVTAAGLIAGRDVIEQLRRVDLGQVVVVPSVALRDGAFLDDVTIAQVEEAIGRPVAAVRPAPTALARFIALGAY